MSDIDPTIAPAYTEEQLAAMLDVCVATLRRRARAYQAGDPRGVPSKLVGRRRVYPRLLLDPWLQTPERSPDGD